MIPEIKQRIEQIRRGEVPEGYKKGKLGIVPKEWNETPFSTLFTSTNDYTDDLDKYPLYSLTIEDGVTPKTERYERSHLVKKEDSYKIIRPDDYAYNPMNLRFGAVARHKGDMAVAVSGYYDIFTTVHESDLPFMDSFLTCGPMITYYNRVSTGSLVEKQRVHFSQFLEFVLPLPSINERAKIAAILTTQDKAIELKEKRLAQKQQQKKYLMQQLLTGRKRLPGFSGEWTDEKLANFCEFVGGGTPDTHNQSFWGGDIPWISSSDLVMDDFKSVAITRFITQQAVEFSAAKLCPKGCILIVSRVGVGKLAIAPTDLCTSQDFTNIIQYKHNSMFLLYALYYLMKKKVKQTQGSAIKGITVKEIKKFSLKFPTISEQAAIAEILSTADHEIDLLQQDVEQEKQKKKALMQLLLTGIVRVKSIL